MFAWQNFNFNDNIKNPAKNLKEQKLDFKYVYEEVLKFNRKLQKKTQKTIILLIFRWISDTDKRNNYS